MCCLWEQLYQSAVSKFNNMCVACGHNCLNVSKLCYDLWVCPSPQSIVVVGFGMRSSNSVCCRLSWYLECRRTSWHLAQRMWWYPICCDVCAPTPAYGHDATTQSSEVHTWLLQRRCFDLGQIRWILSTGAPDSSSFTTLKTVDGVQCAVVKAAKRRQMSCYDLFCQLPLWTGEPRIITRILCKIPPP